MTSSTQPATFLELFTDLQNRVRITTGVSATEDIAKRLINTALHDLHIGYAECLPWCERRSTLVTQPTYTTGTLTVSQGGTSVTGSGTAWNTNNNFGVANVRAGGKLRINGGSEIYEVSTVTNDTSLTITSRFTPETVTAGAYVYYEDEYALASDFLRPIDLTQFSAPFNIELLGRTEFRRRFVNNFITGRPSCATIVDLAFSGNTTPVRKVLFAKPPDRAYSIPYNYATSNLAVSTAGAAQRQLSADDDEPIVPLRYRHVITLHALKEWYRDQKDDDRFAAVKQEYEQLLLRVVGDTEIGQSHPYLRPDVVGYARRAQRPYSR